MILGADTDELREVQQDCLEVARTVDQVVAFLIALVAVLRAASLWTGGSSAVYAAYLEGTVIPWLKKISLAAKLFARVLGANAQAQDEVSAGTSVDTSALPRYQSPTLPTTSCTHAPPPVTYPGGATVAVPPGSGAATVGSSGGTPVGGTAAPVVAQAPTYEGTPVGAGVGAGTPAAGGTVGATSGAGSAGAYQGSGGGDGPFVSRPGSGSGSGPAGGAGSSADVLTPGGGGGGPLGAGESGTASGTTGTDGADPSTYSGGQVATDDPLGGVTATSVEGRGADDGSDAGTYAAAGTAGALGVGSAAALAGRGAGTGMTSPGGFDYTRIQGVRDNPRITPEFLRRTEQIATKLGCKPEDLMAVMSFETGGSFDPAQRNMAGGSARGLIQFMPATARGLGTTSEALTRMTPVQQLDYVERYFGNGRYTTVEGLYSKVLAGRAVNDPEGVLFRQGTDAYRWNRGVDADRDGVITAGEAAAKVRARILPAG